MSINPRALFFATATVVLFFAARANAVDKSQYNLFNPVPPELMREMATDRPDRTESPFTLDAGHFQIEMDILNYAYDRHIPSVDRTSVETVSIAPINLKAGLVNHVDLQVILEPYTSVRIHDRNSGTIERHRGFGDVVTRVKVNLWGDDGGSSALGLLPFLKLPTNQDGLGNNAVEGGLIVPFSIELPLGWELAAMTGIGAIRESRYHVEFVNSVSISHDIVGSLAGYAEFFSGVNSGNENDWEGTIDFGLTYGLTKDIQIDAGVNIGITRAADDVNPFIGLSWRF